MMKAELVFSNGTQVKIEGTLEDVERLLKNYGDPETGRTQTATQPKGTGNPPSEKSGPQQLVKALIDDGFFREKRRLADVNVRLEEQGHYYSIQTIAVNLLRLTKKKMLRRLRDDKGWIYVV
jgi:hypothetical protein